MSNNDELFALLRLEAAAQLFIHSLNKCDSKLRIAAILEMRKAIQALNTLRGFDFDAESIEDLLKSSSELKG